MNNNNKTNIELFYNSTPDIESMNMIFVNLKIFFIEYLKAKFPAIAALSALRHKKLMKIEEERLNELISNIKEKTENIDKNKINYDFIRTEEFARIVFSVFDKAKSDYRKEKLKYYANLLINYSTIDFSKDFYKEDIIDKMSKYAPEHILVLNEISKVDRIDLKDFTIEQIEKDVVDICVYNLLSDGLIYEASGVNFGRGGEHCSISPYGKKFLELLKEVNYNKL